ncbi:twin-arginine translocase TatA/TatE family subunit [Rhodanobacter caeni]|jgi:sec-independent protein translocase protein TatA|uniref:Sec-independent protein translocase protein TatA n=1 Tax=Rhodanobacter caeni TaxID=657654 RepID=A0ABP3EAS3_9GAMM
MSITHLVILLIVVVLIFGTKKLRNIGSDLGGAMRDFKKGLEGEDKPKDEQRLQADPPAANPAEHKQPDSTESK